MPRRPSRRALALTATAAVAAVVIGRSRRPSAAEREVARRVKAGEDHELYLCVDCGREHLDPAHCGCWDRGLF